MNHFDEDLEFDIKALIFLILRQWKRIVIFAIVVAVILGGWQAYSAYTSQQNVEGDSEVELQDYQDEIAFLEERVALDQTRIENLQEYVSDSFLMKMDPRNVYTAKAIYYVDSGYKILPENTYQDTNKSYTLAWFYRRYVNEYSTYERISEMVGIDPKYLKELVDISIPTDFTISITVKHSEQEYAVLILDMLQEEVEGVYAYLNDTVCEHVLTKMEDGCGLYIDEDVQERQQNTSEELLDLKNKQLERSEELQELKEEQEAYMENLLESEEEMASDKTAVIKALVKWFLLGGVLGAVLVIAYAVVVAFFGSRVYAASQLASSFRACVLGELICDEDILPITVRKLNKLEGCLSENSEGNFQFIAENIKNHCGSAKNIMICCDANAEVSKKVADAVNQYMTGIQLQPAANLLKEASALRQLSACDAVILIAQREKSQNPAIEKMLKLTQSCNKEVIGFLFGY